MGKIKMFDYDEIMKDLENLKGEYCIYEDEDFTIDFRLDKENEIIWYIGSEKQWYSLPLTKENYIKVWNKIFKN